MAIDEHTATRLSRLRLPTVRHFGLARQFNLEVHDIADRAFVHQIFRQTHFAQIAKLGSQLKTRAGWVRGPDHLLSQAAVGRSGHFTQHADATCESHLPNRVMRGGGRTQADGVELHLIEHIFKVKEDREPGPGEPSRVFAPCVAECGDTCANRLAPGIEMNLAGLTESDYANTQFFQAVCPDSNPLLAY